MTHPGRAALVELPSRVEEGKADMLSVLDDMRQAIEEGRVVAFCATTVAPNDAVAVWSGACSGVTRLRMMGAIAELQYHFHANPDIC